MPRIYKILSIDESGKASYGHPSVEFVLSGVVIPERLKTKLDNKMKRLKKKYFGNEEIVFHSRDMARKKAKFAALRNAKIEVRFWSEFVSIVNNSAIGLLFVIANKHKAMYKHWHSKTILKRAYLQLLERFAQQLKASGSMGKIVAESEFTQDPYLIYAHNRLQSMGTSNGVVTAADYKGMVTSISLVNKANLDADVQIADALAGVAVLKYHRVHYRPARSPDRIEKMKARLIDRKIENKTNPSFYDVLI